MRVGIYDSNNRVAQLIKYIVCMWCALGLAVLLAFGFAPDRGYAAQGQPDSSLTSAALKSGSASTMLNVQKKKLPSYTVTPKTKPLNTKLLNSDTYTAQTKHWWMLSNIMSDFEEKGGGTLTLKKGVYNLPVSVQVPSNVTVVFEKGVTIKKIAKTGTSRITPNSSLFQMIAPSKKKTVGAVAHYNGTKNVTFKGKGNATFDMGNLNGCAIIMAQNQNMHFSGITFKNVRYHAFELDASKKVVIEKCTFKNCSGAKTDEAINLDVPDPKTKGFNFTWSKMDRTVNQNITIRNCTFDNVMRGVGSHSYSQTESGENRLHTDIKILNNTFKNISGYEGCVVTFNWKNVTISGNTFEGRGTSEKTYGIVAHSVQGANISNNVFSNYQHTILIRRGFTNKYYPAPAEVVLSDSQKELLKTNSYLAGSVVYSAAQVTDQASYGTNKGEWYDLVERAAS